MSPSLHARISKLEGGRTGQMILRMTKSEDETTGEFRARVDAEVTARGHRGLVILRVSPLHDN